jgi:hypothetical protein
MVQAVSRRTLTAEAGLYPESAHMGFMVNKVTLGQVFPEYFGFPLSAVLHYFEKREKNLSSSSQCCMIRLNTVVRP